MAQALLVISQASRRRRHLEEMQLAIAEGLSLDQARERLASYRAQERRLHADDQPASERPELAPEALPWWQRD